MLFTKYPEHEAALPGNIVCEMPNEDDDLDDDFDTAWEKERGEDPDIPFNDGIETDEYALEDEPPLTFNEEQG